MASGSVQVPVPATSAATKGSSTRASSAGARGDFARLERGVQALAASHSALAADLAAQSKQLAARSEEHASLAMEHAVLVEAEGAQAKQILALRADNEALTDRLRAEEKRRREVIARIDQLAERFGGGAPSAAGSSRASAPRRSAASKSS